MAVYTACMLRLYVTDFRNMNDGDACFGYSSVSSQIRHNKNNGVT